MMVLDDDFRIVDRYFNFDIDICCLAMKQFLDFLLNGNFVVACLVFCWFIRGEAVMGLLNFFVNGDKKYQPNPTRV